jgi:hypothetical protein
MLDIQYFYGKAARNEPLEESDLVSLLKELTHFRKSTAYLASCQAATVESLPRSASRSSRNRHVSICVAAAELAAGDSKSMTTYGDLTAAAQRCLLAVKASRGLDAK